MIRGIHHVGIAVSELEPSASGLAKVADLGVALRAYRSDGAGGSVLLRGVNGYVELTEATATGVGPLPVNEAGITHFCVQGRSITGVMDALRGGGFAFPDQPVDLGTGFLYAYGRSPDGAVVEAEGAPFAAPQPASWIGHVAFATHDLARLVSFYAGLLGGETRFSPRLRQNPKYDQVTGLADVDVLAGWVRGGNIALEFWQYLNPPTRVRAAPRPQGTLGYSHVAFETDALDDDVALAQSLGATLDARRDLGWTRAADLRDPDGNILRLMALAPHAADLGVEALAGRKILARVAADFDRHHHSKAKS